MVLTPLLLQGWIPSIATFLNTPAWAMPAEAFMYSLFPWLARWKRPERLGPRLWKLAGIWALAMVPARCTWYSTRTDRASGSLELRTLVVGA